MTRLAIPIRRKVIFDGDSAAVQYIGDAAWGRSTSSAHWRIQRLTYTGGTFVLETADGNDEFDNIWDDRASLSYS